MSLDIYLKKTKPVRVMDANTTHNHVPMAKALGIYQHLWQPTALGITKAQELIAPLRAAIHELETNPQNYRQHNPPNGWGSVENCLSFMVMVLEGCLDHPDADVEVSV